MRIQKENEFEIFGKEKSTGNLYKIENVLQYYSSANYFKVAKSKQIKKHQNRKMVKIGPKLYILTPIILQ